MPMRTSWEPEFETGDDGIDAQHRRMLSLCDRLAELSIEPPGDEGMVLFDETFKAFKALTREHFATEAVLLSPMGDEALEDHRFECEEFDHLADEVATTEHFTRLEIQRFVTLWCIGHVKGSAALLRDAQSAA